MSADWRVFKVFRRDLWMFMAAEVAIILLIAANDIRAQNPESALDSLGVSAFLALLLSISLRMPSRLNGMPFPVTVQQRARLPLLAFVILFGSGIAGMLVVFSCFGFSLSQWCLLGMLILQRIPFYVLAFLLVYRFFQRVPHLIGFVFVVAFLPETMGDPANTVWGSWYFLLLPAALAMIAFFWVEIPQVLAGQDRLLVAQGPQAAAVMRDINIESRQTWVTWTGRITDAMLILGVLVVFWFKVSDLVLGAYLLRVQTYVSRPWLCWFPLGGLFLVHMISKEGYQRASASGFGPYASVWMSLMRMTIVLNPLVKALGVRKGVVSQCDQCRTAKFIWAKRCPHCGFSGPGTVLNKQMARLARGDAVRITMRQKLWIRLFIPMQFLFIWSLAGGAGNRPFESHSVLLGFSDAQAAAQAAAWIGEWIGTRAETDTWLAPAGTVGQIPQKYRVQVIYAEENSHMRVQAYGLRWDSAGALPDRLVDQLRQSLPATLDFTATPLNPRQARSPFMQTRTYLDNGLHWVRRDKLPQRTIRPRQSSNKAPVPIIEKPAKRMPAPPPKRVE